VITIIDLNAELAKLRMLRGRTPETTRVEREDSAAQLAPYRDGGIFASKSAGKSGWERHAHGDELVQIVDGDATLQIVTEDGPLSFALSAGMLAIVPQGAWHRFDYPGGMTLIMQHPARASISDWISKIRGRSNHSGTDDPAHSDRAVLTVSPLMLPHLHYIMKMTNIIGGGQAWKGRNDYASGSQGRVCQADNAYGAKPNDHRCRQRRAPSLGWRRIATVQSSPPNSLAPAIGNGIPGETKCSGRRAEAFVRRRKISGDIRP
jgi:mannose-6-phosphate isomerase-like protein (cupin superfamily)